MNQKIEATNIKNAIESLEESIEFRDWKKTIGFFEKIENISLYNHLLPSIRSLFEDLKNLIQQHSIKQSAWFESPLKVRNEILKTAEHLKMLRGVKEFYDEKHRKFTLQSIIGYKMLQQSKQNTQVITEITSSTLSIYDEMITDLDSVVQELEKDLMSVPIKKIGFIYENLSACFEAQVELTVSSSNLKNERASLTKAYQKDVRFKEDISLQLKRLSNQIINELNLLSQDDKKESMILINSASEEAKTKILEAIKWNFTQIALNKLIDLTQSLNQTEEFETSIMLMSRYKRLEQEKMRDIISKDTYEISINKINTAIIQLLKNF